MKLTNYLHLIGFILLIQCTTPETKTSEYAAVSQVESGKAVSVMLTAYCTTLLADGNDRTRLRIAVTDSLVREITSATDSIRIYVTGNGRLTTVDGKELIHGTDTSGVEYSICQLSNGICNLWFIAGTKPDKIEVEARSEKLWPGAHEIHTIPPDLVMMKPLTSQLPPTTKPIDRMIGADISFLPQIEDRGRIFTENSEKVDALKLLKNHGFNYIRLRVFVNPENKEGYSPDKGYCGLEQTLEMARRIKVAGMKLLLDFHYSDYWADPQKQYKPLNWVDLDFETLRDSLKTYTKNVLFALKRQQTLPAMVQIGNEINHGFLWPDGHIGNPDQLAELLQAGVEGVEAVDPNIPVMMHIALGGQHDEAVFWLDNMIARGVKFDIIGLSYYPRWHGTLDDLNSNMLDLVERYNKPLNVVEYSDYKREVHEMVFSLPNNMGKGACIWEPLNWRSGMFKRNGETTELIMVYDELSEKYLTAPDAKR